MKQAYSVCLANTDQLYFANQLDFNIFLCFNRAEVRDEEYLYQDNETERPEYQKLIRVIRPRIKKKRRRH